LPTAVFRVAVGAAAREKVDEKTRQLLSERPPWFTDALAWQRARRNGGGGGKDTSSQQSRRRPRVLS